MRPSRHAPFPHMTHPVTEYLRLYDDCLPKQCMNYLWKAYRAAAPARDPRVALRLADVFTEGGAPHVGLYFLKEVEPQSAEVVQRELTLLGMLPEEVVTLDLLAAMEPAARTGRMRGFEEVVRRLQWPAAIPAPPPSSRDPDGVDAPVVFTITTCKRLALFQKTMRSVLATWTDLHRVAMWVCVDDNSSREDRAAMAAEFPFLTFVLKGLDQRGHRASMNIIHSLVTASPCRLWVHMEDDWMFFLRDAYIAAAEGCMARHGVQQLVFNRSYGEHFWDQWTTVGAVDTGDGFCLHEYVSDPAAQAKLPGPQCNYWPHYSLQPSVVDLAALRTVPGTYDTTNPFFERGFADKWAAAGHRTGFLNRTSCVHIGKLLRDASGTQKNAYELNGVSRLERDTPVAGAGTDPATAT